MKHDIDIGDAPPVKQRPYCVDSVKRAAMREENQDLLQQGYAGSLFLTEKGVIVTCIVEESSIECT